MYVCIIHTHTHTHTHTRTRTPVVIHGPVLILFPREEIISEIFFSGEVKDSSISPFLFYFMTFINLYSYSVVV